MSNSTEHDKARTENRENVRQLLLSMADTTWRMFIAPAILVPAGIFVDLKLHTKPWLTLAAAFIGLGLSVLMVRQQLRGGR